MIQLRYHQENLKQGVLSTAGDVLGVLPTGGGKSYVMSSIALDCFRNNEICYVFAHRDILITQLSDSLCDLSVPHTFIASKKTVKEVTNTNLQKHGDSFYNQLSSVHLISVDTFLNRLDKPQISSILHRVKYWLMDEAHHVLAENKWGRCVENLVNAKGIGFTATPIRGDGKGLGSHNHGVFDNLVIGANQGELMEKGYLSLYKIYAPPVLLDTSDIKITASGDYNQKKLAEVTDRHDITGDAVKHYMKLCSGKQAITFAVNIAHSDHVAKEFNEAGIPSLSLSSKTPTNELLHGLNLFRQGKILNLVNCDLFGEGFDVPAVEVVIMLRKTASYSLFKQQFGRCLRPSDNKTHGILIDHVGNVRKHCKHGAPHDDPEWTLEPRSNSNDDGTKSEARVCPECFNYYVPKSASQKICPECDHEETKEEINQAQLDFQFNDENLVELDFEFINNLMSKRAEVDQSPETLRNKMSKAPSIVRNSAVNNHIKRQAAQQELRPLIIEWCKQLHERNPAFTKEVVQNEFQIKFKVSIFEAQVLSESRSFELINKIRLSL